MKKREKPMKKREQPTKKQEQPSDASSFVTVHSIQVELDQLTSGPSVDPPTQQATEERRKELQTRMAALVRPGDDYKAAMATTPFLKSSDRAFFHGR
jgi:hypothetical protein